MSNGIRAIFAEWSLSDYWGSIQTRLGIRRNQYRIEPGIYSIGKPDTNSPVLVTANYKLTVNHLKRSVKAISAWVLILDTKGVNVWCAAGKGTFGTDELIKRIKKSELHRHVAHKKLILPQLGAPGINPGEVKESTGFSVIYGPVEAKDIIAFIDNGNKADDYMRVKSYPLVERVLVAITHFSQGLKWTLLFAVVFFLTDLLFQKKIGFQFNLSLQTNIIISLGSLAFGSLIANIFLPFLPGRAFSLKGLFAGLLFTVLFLFYLRGILPTQPVLFYSGKILILWAFIVYQVLNLTGSSTYTSLSGVQKEMALCIPILIATVVLGIALIVGGGLI